MDKFKFLGEKGKKLVEEVGKAVGSKKRAKRLIDEGLVSVNYRKELIGRKTLKGGERIIFPYPEGLFKKPEVKLLKREGEIWIFNKPPFITTNEGKGSLEDIIRKEFNPDLRVVHRLDKQTSGVIIAVEGKDIFDRFKELFRRKELEKEYFALVKGELRRKRVIKTPIEGKPAVTEVEPVEIFKGATLLKVRIETGRKHQIRRHLAQIGHPVVGEFKYYRGSWKEELLFAPRILLHSRKISFKHPETGKKIEVKSEVPEDFKEFLNWLRERKGE